MVGIGEEGFYIGSDPSAFIDEIEMLHAHKIKTEGRLFLSGQAHIILPYQVTMKTPLFCAKRNSLLFHYKIKKYPILLSFPRIILGLPYLSMENVCF